MHLFAKTNRGFNRHIKISSKLKTDNWPRHLTLRWNNLGSNLDKNLVKIDKNKCRNQLRWLAPTLATKAICRATETRGWKTQICPLNAARPYTWFSENRRTNIRRTWRSTKRRAQTQGHRRWKLKTKVTKRPIACWESSTLVPKYQIDPRAPGIGKS